MAEPMPEQETLFRIVVPEAIKCALRGRLLNETYNIDAIYDIFQDYFNQQFTDLAGKFQSYPGLALSDLGRAFSLISSKEIRTGGIDFPLMLRKGSSRPVLMVCAMDPLRADDGRGPNTDLSYWVPFSIIKNPQKEKKYSERENLIFFHTLLNQMDLYVTDIYKLFYREGEAISNSKREFTSLPVHKELLYDEIGIVKPDAILTLGTKARDAVCSIFELQIPTWTDEVFSTYTKNCVKLVMVPHISGAANGAKVGIINNPAYGEISGSGNRKYAQAVLMEIFKSY